jgi:endoglucanase Acf2
MRNALPWILAGLLIVGLAAGSVQAAAPTATQGPAEVVKLGAGGYQERNGGRDEPIRGENLKGPIPTTQWFTNLAYRGKNATNEYPHPLAVRPTPGGLIVHYPGPSINVIGGGFLAGIPKTPDLVLSCSDVDTFEDVRLDAYSDWFVRVAFTAGGKGMDLSYGHGSPFIYALFKSGGASLTCAEAPKVWSGGPQDAVLGITVGKSHYGLFGPTGSEWKIDGAKLVNQGGDRHYFSLALLPDNKPETLSLFRQYAYSHVTDTQVAWKFDPGAGAMQVTYTFTTKPYEGQESGTLTALYPHQWKYASEQLTKLLPLEYLSVRGTMKLAAGTGFTTVTPVQGILPMLPPQGIQDKDRMDGYISQYLPRGGGFGDTYSEGKTLGKLATISEIAELNGNEAAHTQCLNELKRRLEAWFTATPDKSSPVFVYYPNWGVLVGQKGSYGSDWPFNDLHFHYGYFIRAAAEVARCDPAWAADDKWGGMVNLVIRDIACPDRGDKMFPFLRCFDRYAGHSWASGDAGFDDGNNQESSSESMNAWYGITMWGAATGNTAVRDLGLYLFTTEMTAIEEYWMDVADTNFPKEFKQEGLGMIWGGKGAYGTWFSGDADCIYGINYLPYTPGSVYLIRYPEYIKRASPVILAARKAGDNFSAGWGDLHLMFRAGMDPAAAAKYIDANPGMKVEGGNSSAFLYHWIYTLNNLGLIDRTVTADYPLYNVYNKGGKKTYAVYNMSGMPVSVKFSDGMRVDANKIGFTVVTE